jgi:hypothetical protein
MIQPHDFMIPFSIRPRAIAVPTHKQKANDVTAQTHHLVGRWISVIGWLLTGGGGIVLLIGFSDLQNLAILAAAGVVFIPIGLLLIANGRILNKLARIEKNTRIAAEAMQAKPLEESRRPHGSSKLA